MHLDSEAWFPSPYFPQKLYSKTGLKGEHFLYLEAETHVLFHASFIFEQLAQSVGHVLQH